MAVVQMPEPGEVIVVIGDGHAFAYGSVPRALVEDAEANSNAMGNALADLDKAIAELGAADSHL
jgi:hypothetical protein